MKTIIIAEAGVNHNGDINLAKKLIEAASDAGADYIKFQTFKSDRVVTTYSEKTEYQKKNFNDFDTTQYKMLKNLELIEEDHYKLISYCNDCKIKFLSSGFDIESIDFLDKLNLDFFKIPSGEITNKPYLEHIARKKKKVIISTGMANISEIKDAINIFMTNGFTKNDIIILHCTTDYPAKLEDVNLIAMLHIKNEFNTNVGYSDHTLGIEVPLAAVALGAVVIEKHITLDRKLNGPDHKASLEPNEFKLMVKLIRNIELAISGSGIKEPSLAELKNRSYVRKSIVASKVIKKNEEFNYSNITVKRPGNGISPMLWDEVIGKKAKKDFNKDDLIEL